MFYQFVTFLLTVNYYTYITNVKCTNLLHIQLWIISPYIQYVKQLECDFFYLCKLYNIIHSTLLESPVKNWFRHKKTAAIFRAAVNIFHKLVYS